MEEYIPASFFCYWNGSIPALFDLFACSFLAVEHPDSILTLYYDQVDNLEVFKNRFSWTSQILFKPVDWSRLELYFPGVKIEEKTETLTSKSNFFRLYHILDNPDIEILIYTDLDVAFLRPIYKQEMLYQWSTQDYANNAILIARKDGSFRNLIKNRWSGSARPMVIFKYPLDFPKGKCSDYDPLWEDVDRKIRNFDDFFNPRMTQLFFSGGEYSGYFKNCYVHHWHNRWHIKKIDPKSAAGIILRNSIEKCNPGFQTILF